MNLTASFPVVESSQVAVVRRAAEWLADSLDFSDARSGQVALVVTELATNLVRHAQRGEVLFRHLEDGRGSPASGLEVLAIDHGPGIKDPALSRRDGYSTGGTLGHGLGAVERQADLFELFTQPAGTVAMAHIWRDPAKTRRELPVEVGAVLVSMHGEEVCGDGWCWRARDNRFACSSRTASGHGLHAHEASKQAVNTFLSHHENEPRRIIEDVHAALRSTRGAAVSALALDLERGVARYSGLGNVSALITSPGSRHSLVSHNGIAGHTAARIQEFSYPLPGGATIVMHTDGLATQWDLGAYSGIDARHPSITAGLLYRDFSRRRDDVTVVVAKARRPHL